jgi:hypothetical protein
MSGSGPRRAVAADVDGTGIMCDWTPVRNWLIGIAAAIVSAAAIALGAAVVNPNVWYSWLAPLGMLIAAAVTGTTVLVCGAAISALDTFCACAGSKCAGPCGNLRRTLEAARIVLGIQATACLTAALTAWIPGIGSAPIWVIIGALLIQLALIIAAIVFMSQLASCQSTPPPTSPSPPTPPTPPNPAGPIGWRFLDFLYEQIRKAAPTPTAAYVTYVTYAACAARRGERHGPLSKRARRLCLLA